MRQIVLDTETTGLSWEKGNRVVEIGCVELIERRPSGRRFQKYLRPDCPFEPGAQEVTGLTLEFLADKPAFADVVEEFIEFVRGAELVIHNAAFDVGFLDNELMLAGPAHGRLGDHARVLDTLEALLGDGRAHVLGNGFSAVDVYLGSALGWGMFTGGIEARPAFTAYVGRLRERPAARRASAADDALIPRPPAG